MFLFFLFLYLIFYLCFPFTFFLYLFFYLFFLFLYLFFYLFLYLFFYLSFSSSICLSFSTRFSNFSLSFILSVFLSFFLSFFFVLHYSQFLLLSIFFPILSLHSVFDIILKIWCWSFKECGLHLLTIAPRTPLAWSGSTLKCPINRTVWHLTCV